MKPGKSPGGKYLTKGGKGSVIQDRTTKKGETSGFFQPTRRRKKKGTKLKGLPGGRAASQGPKEPRRLRNAGELGGGSGRIEDGVIKRREHRKKNLAKGLGQRQKKKKASSAKKKGTPIRRPDGKGLGGKQTPQGERSEGN